MKDFESVGVERGEVVDFFWRVDKRDFQFSAVHFAVSVSAEVRVFEGVLVCDVDASVGDEDREPMC